MKTRLREYRKMSRQKAGFQVAKLIGGDMPMWATSYLFHSLWDLVTQWGYIEVMPSHVIHVYSCLGEGFGAFGIEDFRIQHGELSLILAVPRLEFTEFNSQFDCVLSNGITVRCDREMTPNLLFDTILETDQLQIYQNYRLSGFRYARPLRERYIPEVLLMH